MNNTPKTFKKNNRVSCEYKGVKQLGIVVRGGSSIIHVKMDAGNSLKGHSSLFEHSDALIPSSVAKANAPKSFKKGERVKCMYNNEEHHGIVTKGGSNKVHVILDVFPVDEYLSIHTSLLSDSDKPTLYIKETLADNVLSCAFQTSRIAGREGFPSVTTIKRGGVKLFSLTDQADGGPLHIDFFNKASECDFESVFRMACDWFKAHSNCSQKTFEKLLGVDQEWKQIAIADMGEWMANYGKLGLSPKDHTKNWMSRFCRFSA